MRINVVTHCWAGKYPQFAAALAYQLSSLVVHPTRADVRVVLLCTPTDMRVRRVTEYYDRQVQIVQHFMALDKLGRRSIGRNYAAMHLCADADVVWFTDVDYVFRAGCMDGLTDYEWPDGVSMIFPRAIKISKTHPTGDATLAMLEDKLGTMDVDPQDFTDKRYFRAIGGAQIVRGFFARTHGYLNNDDRWQRPTDSPFSDTREDIQYRKFAQRHGSIVGIDLPGVYRLRHSGGHPD